MTLFPNTIHDLSSQNTSAASLQASNMAMTQLTAILKSCEVINVPLLVGVDLLMVPSLQAKLLLDYHNVVPPVINQAWIAFKDGLSLQAPAQLSTIITQMTFAALSKPQPPPQRALAQAETTPTPAPRPPTVAQLAQDLTYPDAAYPTQRGPTVPFPKQKKATREAKPDSLPCVCGRADECDISMIGCDLCGRWYHLACVNVAKAEVEMCESWACPYCRDYKGKGGVIAQEEHATYQGMGGPIPLEFSSQLDRSWVDDQGLRYVPQAGDIVLYFPRAHLRWLLNPGSLIYVHAPKFQIHEALSRYARGRRAHPVHLPAALNTKPQLPNLR